MKFGYARVSTKDQSLDLQKDALEKAGCEKIYSEHISGANKERPQLKELVRQLRNGDTITVWKLDFSHLRLTRSVRVGDDF